MPPKIEKRHIIDIEKVGKVFTFEATRHIVPARPLDVDVLLDLLKDRDISIEEANRKFSTLLKEGPETDLSGASLVGLTLR